uniref:Sorting nexin-16 n=1 Tax=Heterorhabditis bacteriophora TaxID=37862 RepID=A0A1I7XH06_HETBA
MGECSRTGSTYGFGSLSSLSSPANSDGDEDRSIYQSPSPISRSLKTDNVREIFFKATVDDKLLQHKEELERDLRYIHIYI